jgi:hypothetical protein
MRAVKVTDFMFYNNSLQSLTINQQDYSGYKKIRTQDAETGFPYKCYTILNNEQVHFVACIICYKYRTPPSYERPTNKISVHKNDVTEACNPQNKRALWHAISGGKMEAVLLVAVRPPGFTHFTLICSYSLCSKTFKDIIDLGFPKYCMSLLPLARCPAPVPLRWSMSLRCALPFVNQK